MGRNYIGLTRTLHELYAMSRQMPIHCVYYLPNTVIGANCVWCLLEENTDHIDFNPSAWYTDTGYTLRCRRQYNEQKRGL